jgi:hypothetical protein
LGAGAATLLVATIEASPLLNPAMMRQSLPAGNHPRGLPARNDA